MLLEFSTEKNGESKIIKQNIVTVSNMFFFIVVLLWEVVMTTKITLLFNWNVDRRGENYNL
jgi:hypothetical protein